MPTTLLATLATAAVTAALVWLWARSRSAALAATLAERDDQLARAGTELAALRARLPELVDIVVLTPAAAAAIGDARAQRPLTVVLPE